MTPSAENLRKTNQRLRRWLEQMSTNRERGVAKATVISELLSELISVGTELRSEAIPARGANLEFDGELDRYRQNVEQLRKLLPSIQGQLLAQRARIESQRARIESAAHWARASRQTL